MKLDNRGWGYRDMIIYSSIIIICLIVVVVFSKIMNDNINSLSSSSNDSSLDVQSNPYYEYEKEMRDAGFTYIQKNNYSDVAEIKKISLDTLIGFQYISILRDKVDGSECKGYILIDRSAPDNYIVSPYLKCSSYVTNGYKE